MKDIPITIGQIFGKLTVIEELPRQKNIHSKRVKCRCECGNEHVTTISHLRTGHVTQCRECFRKLQSNSNKKYSLDVVKDFYNARNIVYSDDWFDNARDKHNLECKTCGYKWQSSFQNSRKHGCPQCGMKQQHAKLRQTLSQIKERVLKKGIQFLDDEYAGNQHERHQFKCLKCCEVFTSTVSNVLYSVHGHKCKITLKQAQQVCKQKNITFLNSQFNIIDDYYSLQCNVCGYVWKTQFTHVLYSNTAGCPKCHKYGKLAETIILNNLYKIFGDTDVVYQYPIKTFNAKLKRYTRQQIDFFIPTLKLGIEYNGRQHYESTNLYGLFKTDLNCQIERDNRKREYCKANGIKLIEIDGRLFEKHPENLTAKYIIQLLGEAGIIY